MSGFSMHTYAWYAPGTVDERVLECFKAVIDYHGLSEFTTLTADSYEEIKESLHYKHGYFIDQVLRQGEHDVTLFVDLDFLISDPGSVYDLCRFAYYQKSFAGVAHNVGHTNRPHHLFAGAPLLAVSKDGYQRLGQPSAIAGLNHDTAQLFSLTAEENSIPYFASYPTGYDWPAIGLFGHYGPIGRGIWYPQGYHLLGGSEESWQTLKATRADAIERFALIAELICQGETSKLTPRYRCNTLSHQVP